MKTVINSYEDIFKHSDKVGCVLNSCNLMTAGACGTPLPTLTDIVLGPSPNFSITASELIPTGYSHSFCLSCVITPTGLPMVTYAKD